MENDFLLPVSYEGKQTGFPARLLNYGYSFKLEVTIDDTKVLFEPDEERNWRALISYDDMQLNKKLNTILLRSIAEAIESITK
jgi:hypothetical protein